MWPACHQNAGLTFTWPEIMFISITWPQTSTFLLDPLLFWVCTWWLLQKLTLYLAAFLILSLLSNACTTQIPPSQTSPQLPSLHRVMVPPQEKVPIAKSLFLGSAQGCMQRQVLIHKGKWSRHANSSRETSLSQTKSSLPTLPILYSGNTLLSYPQSIIFNATLRG
jgi:hypothetical protein